MPGPGPLGQLGFPDNDRDGLLKSLDDGCILLGEEVTHHLGATVGGESCGKQEIFDGDRYAMQKPVGGRAVCAWSVRAKTFWGTSINEIVSTWIFCEIIVSDS